MVVNNSLNFSKKRDNWLMFFDQQKRAVEINNINSRVRVEVEITKEKNNGDFVIKRRGELHVFAFNCTKFVDLLV